MEGGHKTSFLFNKGKDMARPKKNNFVGTPENNAVVEEIQNELDSVDCKEEVITSFQEELIQQEPEEIAEVITKAIVLKDFNAQIPMQGHRTTVCGVAFKRGQEITDPYTINVLIDAEKPIQIVE